MGNRFGKPSNAGSVTTRSDDSSCRTSSAESTDFWEDVFRGRRSSTTDSLQRPKLSISDNNVHKNSASVRPRFNTIEEKKKERSVIDYSTYRIDNSVLKPEAAYHNIHGHHMHHYGGLCPLNMADDPDECWILL